TAVASKWRTYRAEICAGNSHSFPKRISVRDGSHFVVPPGFDRFGRLLRWAGSKYMHIPSPSRLALSPIASNLSGIDTNSEP
ncbi:unnamed protein product, partial [Ectocarpus fasciculatus]